MPTRDDKIARADLLLARLHSRLYRTVNAIKKVDAQRKRLLDKQYVGAGPDTRQQTPPPERKAAAELPKVADTLPAPDDSLDIPALFRRPVVNPADAAAKAAILAEQAAKAKNKRAASKAKAGDALAKQPLSGKAALAVIRG